jgi:flagellar biosynthesis/type III secretory pathway chaperone
VDHDQLIKAFAATVQASLHGLQSLEPVLHRERDALAGRDPGQLQRIVEDKLTRLKALEPSVTARDRLLAAAGLQPGLDGGSQLVTELDDVSLSRDWSELVSLAQHVAELNDCNAQLAAQGQRAARTALGILTGRPRNEDTYADLRRKPAATTRPILGKV